MCVGVSLFLFVRAGGNGGDVRIRDSGCRVQFAFRPSPRECRVMLAQIYKAMGRQGCCALLGVNVMSLRGWLTSYAVPTATSRRCIWLVWCLLFHPERLATIEDVVTWGRFHERRKSAVKVPRCEWSDWSI